MNHLKHCFGCVKLTDVRYSPPDAIRKCVYLMPNSNGECPCSHCIVKMMCSMRCPSFYNFRQPAKLRNDGSIS